MNDRRKPMEGLAEWLRTRADRGYTDYPEKFSRWADEVEASAAPLLGAMPTDVVTFPPLPPRDAFEIGEQGLECGLYRSGKLQDFARAAVLADRATRADPQGALEVLREIVECEDAFSATKGTLEEAHSSAERYLAAWARARALIAATPAQAPQADKGPTVAPWTLNNNSPCLPEGLKFDAFGEERKRYFRVKFEGQFVVCSTQAEADEYRENDPEGEYEFSDVWLSEREFETLPEFDGF